MKTLLAIAGAGAIGSVSRYALGVYVQRVSHVAFPLGTLVVNVLGCFLIGLLAGHFMNDESAPVVQNALVVGFCGGFTTFSAFSLETLGLLAGGQYVKAGGYMLGSVVLCLLVTGAGFAMTRP